MSLICIGTRFGAVGVRFWASVGVALDPGKKAWLTKQVREYMENAFIAWGHHCKGCVGLTGAKYGKHRLKVFSRNLKKRKTPFISFGEKPPEVKHVKAGTLV